MATHNQAGSTGKGASALHLTACLTFNNSGLLLDNDICFLDDADLLHSDISLLDDDIGVFDVALYSLGSVV